MLINVVENIDKLVVRFPGGMREVNCYLLKGDNGYTVIDTGTYTKEAMDTWKTFLESGVVVEKVVLTHTHQDHIGLAKWFQEQIGVPVFTSRRGYTEMLKGRNFKSSKEKLDGLIKRHGGEGLPDRLHDDSIIYDFEPDGFFEENDIIQLGNHDYKVIWAPGHAPDQYMFYQTNRKVMIVGDHILNNISPVIGLWNGEETNPMKEYYQSLEILKNYPTEIALPGHSEVILDFDSRVQWIKDRHDYRLDQLLGYMTENGKSANELSKEIYGPINPAFLLSPFMATLTRLIYLESLGYIRRVEENGKVLFGSLTT
ncbi:MBL fold metallo-hydrolase [Oceanobacillus saliphilus]|uniref:MBL fold metallo-hydrolase n=1 Tax=Oceanobacillus saliphilus TaxID=2925834 RepID=UPI00201E23B3|nr:MBL fold metallo-hydrolase [Oceanobacillus saliphilus]